MKKLIALAPLALILSSVSVQAVDPIAHQMTVTATIPTADFYVTPAGGGNWMNDPQNLDYDSQTKTLATFSRQLNMKSTTGAISAKLTSPIEMSNGTPAQNIGLSVLVNNVALTTTSAEVLAATAAATGQTVPFQVRAAAAPTGGYAPGSYTGLVGMLFETVTP
ncbi:fimbrial protein [Buttiauxella sp. A2-C1_F]|uniref:CS1 type fimbrial major subunit n=1 Tax=Buttiauxella sp. A2-C1_F TaxID=2904526 RepID=UPI001E3CCB85|nr:CS1 type fimbrial major subunit [Buttiauxella sp. A2-C1_F]MCE0844150.1 fimbrial protein [Buttiauxella sp. A2-C1_F]